MKLFSLILACFIGLTVGMVAGYCMSVMTENALHTYQSTPSYQIIK